MARRQDRLSAFAEAVGWSKTILEVIAEMVVADHLHVTLRQILAEVEKRMRRIK